MKQIFDALLEIKTMLTEGNLNEKKVLTLNEACKYTGLSKSKLYKMSCNQKVSVSKPEGKLFFKRLDLDNYMLSNYIPSKKNITDNISNYFSKKS